MYFCLHWVFVAGCRLSRVVVSGGYSPAVVGGLLTAVAYCGAAALGQAGFNSCGTQACLPRGMWNLPGPGIELTSCAMPDRIPTGPSGEAGLLTFNANYVHGSALEQGSSPPGSGLWPVRNWATQWEARDPMAPHCSHYNWKHTPTPPCLWKNCLLWNWSLVPKSLGIAAWADKNNTSAKSNEPQLSEYRDCLPPPRTQSCNLPHDKNNCP